MTRVSRSLFVGMLLAAALIKADHLLARDLVTVDLTQWSLPDLAAVGDDPFVRLVKYGHALVTNTANEIGPAVADPTSASAATIWLARIVICRPARNLMPCR